MKSAKIDGLAHIGLFVQDIQKSYEFYSQILEFKLIWESVNPSEQGDILVKFIKNGNCIIELAQFPAHVKRYDGCFDHIALNIQNIDEVIQHLKKKGIVFEEGSYTHSPGTFSNGSKWILFRGPDQEHIELNERL